MPDKKKMTFIRCAVIVLLCGCVVWFYSPISWANEPNEYIVDFSAVHPSGLLKDSMIRLPLFGLSYALDLCL